MVLARVQNRNPWSEFHQELDRMLGGSSNVATSDWVPVVDIKEEKDRFVLHADLPGVKREDIDITMEDGVLSIRGERRLEEVQDEGEYKRIERAYGSFYRRFSLPDTADADNISARSNDGVLEVVIPKRESVKPRRIEIGK
jgi:HSP20 family protein